MARRKRLTPAQPDYLSGDRAPGSALSGPLGASAPSSAAPIAQVAGEASVHAALEELSREVEAARADGRMIEALPLEAVDEGYLVRDRMVQDEEEMAALMDSIRARGQQTAIEVVPLPGGGRYGLVSGWRRLTALKRLQEEEGGARFASVLARIVSPETAQAAYVAMVEENEIRANLSFYERARIVVQALREGVYPTRRAALQGLFGSTTRSRRSKIGSFMALVEAFDGDLKHPTAISEKLGLALVRELVRDPGFADRVRGLLQRRPERTASEEVQILVSTLRPPEAAGEEKADSGAVEPPKAERPATGAAPDVAREHVAPGITVSFYPSRGKIELSGPKVDEGLLSDLRDWLAARAG